MKLNPSGIRLSLRVYMGSSSSILGRSQTLGSIQQSQKSHEIVAFFFNSSLDY